MIELYREILETILFPPDQNQGLALVTEIELRKESQVPGNFVIPRSLFPETCKVLHLPPGEAFITSMQSTVAETQPSRLFLLPPLMSHRNLSDKLRTEFPRLSLEEVVFQVASEALEEGSHLAAMLPLHSFCSERSRIFREGVTKSTTLRLVVEHGYPWQVTQSNIHSALRVSTLFVKIGRSDTPTMRFFKCPEVFSKEAQEKVISDLRQLMKQGGGQTEYGYVLRGGLFKGESLLYSRHHPELVRHQKDMAHIGAVRPLSETVEILKFQRGLYSKHCRDLSAEKEPSGGVPAIGAWDIHADGSLSPEKARFWAMTDVPEELRLRAGDLCLNAIVGSSDFYLSVAEIEERMLPIVALDSVIVLRPKPSITPQERELLIAYLRSERALEFLQARGMMGLNLTPKQLEELPVPVPDDEITASLRSLDEAIAKFDLWKRDAEKARSCLFELESAKDARLHILSTGRITRQRAEAAALIDDISHRIRTRYPHPIAYRWRMVEASHPDLQGCFNVLQCAEVTVCYLSLVAVAVARLSGEKIKWVGQMAKRLSKKARGTNLGDWLAILREVRDSKQLRNSLTPFLYQVTQLLDERTDGALQQLKDLRDDISHGRGPTGEPGQLYSLFEESKSDLQILLQETEFLSEYPLRYIEKTRRDSMKQLTFYDYRDLVGDHPFVPLELNSCDVPELEAGSLYLANRNNELSLLRPLLSRRQCLECGSWATFYLDTYDSKKDVCYLKSMERGHVIQDSKVSNLFRYVGLLLAD